MKKEPLYLKFWVFWIVISLLYIALVTSSALFKQYMFGQTGFIDYSLGLFVPLTPLKLLFIVLYHSWFTTLYGGLSVVTCVLLAISLISIDKLARKWNVIGYKKTLFNLLVLLIITTITNPVMWFFFLKLL